jgi:hypothetical protein
MHVYRAKAKSLFAFSFSSSCLGSAGLLLILFHKQRKGTHLSGLWLASSVLLLAVTDIL